MLGDGRAAGRRAETAALVCMCSADGRCVLASHGRRGPSFVIGALLQSIAHKLVTWAQAPFTEPREA